MTECDFKQIVKIKVYYGSTGRIHEPKTYIILKPIFY